MWHNISICFWTVQRNLRWDTQLTKKWSLDTQIQKLTLPKNKTINTKMKQYVNVKSNNKINCTSSKAIENTNDNKSY